MHIVTNPRVSDGENLLSWRRLIPYLAYFSLAKVGAHSPIAYHALNLAIHLGLSVLVFIGMRDFVRFLLPDKGTGQAEAIPLLVALLFACHPLGSEPINYARCTPIQLVSLFSFIAAWQTLRLFFVQGRALPSATMVVLAILGATFSKEPGLVHATGSVAVVAWFCWPAKLTLAPSGQKRKTILGLAVIGVLIVLPAATQLLKTATAAVATPDFADHALTQSRVFWMYVQRMLFPVNLSVDHYILWTRSWSDVIAVFALVAIVASCVVTLLAGRRNRFLATAIALSAFHLIIRFGYVIGREMMVEYRTYPSLPWVAVVLTCLVLGLGSLLTKRVGRIVSFTVLASFISLAATRSLLWSKPDALVRDVLRQYPENNRARAVLMRQLLNLKRYDALEREHKNVLMHAKSMIRHNSDNAATRSYDHSRIFGDWASAETFYAPGIVATKGPDAALNHMDVTIDVLKGDRATIKDGEALKGLVDFRDRLLEFKKSEEKPSPPGEIR